MAINWYDPAKPRTTTGAGARASYSAVPGAGDPNKKMMVGQLTTDQLLDPQWGFGVSFQAAAKKAQVEAMKNGMSSANPEDYAGMDELRDYYRGQLADLPGQTNNQISSFDTQSQRGLANLLNQYKTQNPNAMGTRQFSGAQGDITSRATNDYMTGLMNAKTAGIGQANQIQNGLTGVQNQNFNERQFQFNQGKGLSDLYSSMVNQDQGREGMLAGQGGGGDWMDAVLPAVGMAAGALIPGGGMIAPMIGGALGGAASGNPASVGSGMQSGMGLAQLMQQQKMLNQQPSYVQPNYNYASNPATSYTGGNAPWWK